MSTQVSHRRRGAGRPAPAFSLAEMMIALIILGFGLLVIGAALPVGFKYTKETVDRATGDAAVEYALDVIEQRIRLVDAVYSDAGVLVRRADLFRPRDATSTPPGRFLSSYEPLIKVRPLVPMSIDSTPGPTFGQELSLDDENNPYFGVERRIHEWLLETVGGALPRREYDAYVPSAPNWVAPALPSVSAVYPPIDADQRFEVDGLYGFFGHEYERRQVFSPGYNQGAETLKALERGMTWTAFYRRVSYASGSDPNLYEVIAVASRLPSGNHRFPRFDPTVAVSPTGWRARGGDPAGDGVVYANGDTLSPVPWLVAFVELPLLVPGPNTYDPLLPGRPLAAGFVDPPTLQFVADEDTTALLPPGSIFIPAVNDGAPDVFAGSPTPQRAGFVPHAPDTLPIYEVERTEQVGQNRVAIIVKNNGFYPWLFPGTELQTVHWPVWVIPPAFKELDAPGGDPVFEKRSSIVAYARRFIRFREIP